MTWEVKKDQSLYLEGCKKQHTVLALKLRNSSHKLIVSWGCTHKKRKSVGLYHTRLCWRKSRAKYVHLIKTVRVQDQGEKKTKGADASHHKSRRCLVLRSHGHRFSFQQLKLGAISHNSRAKVKIDIILKCCHSWTGITSVSQSTWNEVWSDPSQSCGFSSSSILSTLKQTTLESAAFQQAWVYTKCAEHQRITGNPNGEKDGKRCKSRVIKVTFGKYPVASCFTSVDRLWKKKKKKTRHQNVLRYKSMQKKLRCYWGSVSGCELWDRTHLSSKSEELSRLYLKVLSALIITQQHTSHLRRCFNEQEGLFLPLHINTRLQCVHCSLSNIIINNAPLRNEIQDDQNIRIQTK